VTDPVVFLLAALTLLAVPGPTNVLLSTGGATLGFRRALPLLLGGLCGYLLSIEAIRLLLAPLIGQWPAIVPALKVIASLYLVWLAVRLWQRRGTTQKREVTAWMLLVATLVNPKALIFAVSVFPADSPVIWLNFVAFSAIALVTGTAWILIGFGLDAAAGERSRWLPRIASVTLVGFAGYIAAQAL
jgi:threonine/homoserine/homoserine lactone efflux protein